MRKDNRQIAEEVLNENQQLFNEAFEQCCREQDVKDTPENRESFRQFYIRKLVSRIDLEDMRARHGVN